MGKIPTNISLSIPRYNLKNVQRKSVRKIAAMRSPRKRQQALKGTLRQVRIANRKKRRGDHVEVGHARDRDIPRGEKLSAAMLSL